MKKFMKWKGLIALFAAAALVLTACGGGAQSTSNNPSNAATPPNSAGASNASGDQGAEKVKIGLLLPFAGTTFAPAADSIKKGFDLYVEENGAQLGGRKAEILYMDDEANPQTALRNYRQLVKGDKVDILVSPISSSVAYALRDEVEKDKILLINPNASASDLSWDKKSDYVYRLSYSGWQQGASGAKYIAEHIGKRAVTVAPDYPAGKEIMNAFKLAFEAAGGEVINQLWPELNTNDYAPQLTQISKDKPDVVFTFLAGSDQFRFTQQYSEFGLKDNIPLTGNNNFADFQFTSAVGDASAGIIASTQYTPWLENEVNKKFVESYQNKYGTLPDMFSEQGYTSALAIHEAMTKAGSKKTEDLIPVLKGLTLEAPRGTITIDPNTHNPIQDFYITENVKEDGMIVTKVIEEIKQYGMPEQAPAN